MVDLSNLPYPVPPHEIENIVAFAREPALGVEIRDRRWRLRQYRQCFVGSEMVDWILAFYNILEFRHSDARAKATLVGQELVDAGLVRHVVDKDKPFRDATLFYVFCDDSTDAGDGVPVPGADKPADVDDISDFEVIDLAIRALGINPDVFSDDADGVDDDDADDAPDDGAAGVGDAVRPPVEIKDRKYRLRTYKQCFLGSELVDWLAAELGCSREAALGLAVRMEKAEVFEHVVRGHPIKDEPLFYHLCMPQAGAPSSSPLSLYQFEMTTLDGDAYDFSALHGKVVIVTNIGTRSKLAESRFLQLQAIHELYSEQGLIVLGVPSTGEFDAAEPSSAAEIRSIANSYGVTFQLLQAAAVNGSDAHPLFAWIKDKASSMVGKAFKAPWTMIVFSRTGELIKRFSHTRTPSSMIPLLQDLLLEV
ncbi:glutathione peroxidase [Thecamonas trahens ATCC 50062]|uniref:Glutathione peroxidase n=1 Tax=Thecamonas trahens ATCC 50062 TaxID=461836 RepID=A0A0L0DJI1_THETB|nr:glutathione peroxidase [Thecamonas trahens ATCC 50062]KNC52365.1 glutathione peroxidase [Thecamonas trahens ATCC 50062]|eukprot:XP_013755414.1 glutathione peroxidase [Thecamonas trahens ATCC 50062]